jgi:aminobenzoyl-glutamate utilization protein B
MRSSSIPHIAFLALAVSVPSLAAAADPKASHANATTSNAEAWKAEGFAMIEANADHVGRVSDAIFSYSEIGFQEFKTVALMKKELEAKGFKVETGIGGMPTAYKATLGSGGPVIGLMGESDGVRSVSQKPAVLVHDPVVPGAPGDGEGHGASQAALLATASALADLKRRHDLAGTIVVYGGPAAASDGSRPYMVKADAFRGVDVILDAQIGTDLSTSYGVNSLALISVQWFFHGKQAHAFQPWKGRSSLDAVEMLDTATNYMREHTEPEAQIHYVITEGGHQPNVVPAEASVWYYFRHADAQSVWNLFARGREAAKGAALATSTTVSERILSASWPFNGNRALAELVQDNIEKVGMPGWSPDDQAFAKAFQTSMGAPVTGLPTTVTPLKGAGRPRGSTDAGDVTWQVPYARLNFPGKPSGELAERHWSAVVGPATPLAHKGITAASKVLMASALDLMTDPQRIAAIKEDFQAQLSKYPNWKSLLPPDFEPPVDQNKELMEKYRPRLAPYEYDANSKRTYLEFLKIKYPPAMPTSAVGEASDKSFRNAQDKK